MYRVYLRGPDLRVTEKIDTEDRIAALAAFEELVDRTELDGLPMLAVLTMKGQPVAHHHFAMLPSGQPHDPAKFWRGKLDKIEWPPIAR
jgi:hypothetical protein